VRFAEFADRFGGNDAGVRNKVAFHLFRNLGRPCSVAAIAKVVGMTSLLGPGQQVQCTPEHVLRTVRHNQWTLERRRLPLVIVVHDNDTISLNDR
jgi:hypothetical protein